MKQWKAKVKIFCIRLFFLWLPFSIGCLIAIPVSLIAVLSGSIYAKNMLLSMDKLAASVLHWPGTNTISAECGKTLHPIKHLTDWLTARCIFCGFLCWLLNLFDAGHCETNARDEKLIDELLGDK